MRDELQQVMDGRDLDREAARALFDLLMDGRLSPVMTAALLVALRSKGESVAEISGAAESMRRHALLIDCGGLPVVDTCGTGGDRTGSFNISTAAALVTAGAGVRVAKHGNRAITSRCGSADVLAELGVNLDAAPEIVEECIQEAGMGFLFAPRLHPAMRHVGEIRRELGVRTVFNMLGPLTNPAGARAQLLGVFDPALTEPFARVLRDLGSRRAMVVHGSDGMDEITVTGATRISELRSGQVRTYEFDPLPLIGEYYKLSELRGGVPADNARIIRAVLDGAPGAPRAVVLLNAAAGIMMAGDDDDWTAAFERACKSIDEGAARRVLREMADITSGRGA